MSFMDLQSIKQRFGIIGNSPELNRALTIALQVAPTDLSVLVTGESGVGKERIPQIIHSQSLRKHNTYIAVNCGAIPEGTIDSELFGHVKGSFTSAHSDRKGYFEEANNGTIFLDEVAELPMATQVRLLRVLETGEFLKVGSSKIEKTNVRVIAATNVDLKQRVSEGKFREDLYYRLNTVPIYMPPLRNRGDDIHLLFRKFALDFAEKYRMPAIKLTDDAIELLKSYRWPGNIRQLKNVTEQISIIEKERFITAEILRKYLEGIDNTNLPALAKSSPSDSFASERELLYKILFDMKKDMNELKMLVNNIIAKYPEVVDDQIAHTFSDFDDEIKINNLTTFVKKEDTSKTIFTEKAEEVEEVLSLAEHEKDLIIKALEKNNNKRKLAAQELGISERTLYRKIKEYGINTKK
ncbi:MAG: sigma-54 dependent transcriptional regulator [Bacteroidales bacterium]|nr:sigma-54 dependent transcriptional regulator [Bacteroidales bacterium]HOL98449.1 sigma-54 dependent transcriptional regulator [Bacteroidales bacterium]HOM35927.1 sigma-54 dependent transcriptional regulator [Bacteroidales bacterium]HPD24353.1 sigma-54 dependent transcriptional regulator [Bacteroidales bacterium]HRT00183.1 sigma-54 dependent transcriptional regulator [Bacteroidales bacterium]